MKRLFILLSILPCAAQASNWIQSATATNGASWYVDIDSVKDVSDGYGVKAIKAWVKIDYTKVAAEEARQRIVLFHFKCDEEQAKQLSTVRYKADGSVLDTYTPSYSSYQPVVPESVLNGAMVMACTAATLKKDAMAS